MNSRFDLQLSQGLSGELERERIDQIKNFYSFYLYPVGILAVVDEEDCSFVWLFQQLTDPTVGA